MTWELTASISNAVAAAIDIRIKSLPITPEEVLKALKQKEDQIKLVRDEAQGTENDRGS